MANKHSEIIGSFIRRGTFPMEADYIFKSEQELIDFYSKEENEAILHEGLLKIVATEEGQTLYWCLKDQDKLIFKPLIESKDIESINKEITDLKEKLEKELERIWGTEDPDTLDQEYGNISKLIEKLKNAEKEIKDHTERLDLIKNILNLLAGTENLSEPELEEFIDSYTWNNIATLDDFLSYFWSDDPTNRFNNVTNWKHLDSLFENLNTSKPISTHLKELWIKIMGDAHPDEKYDTLMKIKNLIQDINKTLEQHQDELDKVETSVGLHATGLYKSDPSTKHIKNATSVMDALSILDRLIDNAIKNQSLKVADTSSLKLSIKDVNDANQLSGEVKISPENENMLLIKDNGLWSSVELTYDKGQISLLVNGNIKNTFNIGINNIVKDIKYEPSQEAIVFVFKNSSGDDQIINVPVSNLLTEWDVDNSSGNNVVHLTKKRVIGQGADMLSADVRIFENDFNILTRKEKALYVDGRTSNLRHNGTLLNTIIDELQKTTKENSSNISEIQTEIKLIKKDVETNKEEIKTIKGTISEIQQKQIKLINDVKSVERDLKSTNEQVSTLSKNVENHTSKIELIEKEVSTVKQTAEQNKQEISKVEKENQQQDDKLQDLEEKINKFGDIKLDQGYFKIRKEVELPEGQLWLVDEEIMDFYHHKGVFVYTPTNPLFGSADIFNSVVKTFDKELLDNEKNNQGINDLLKLENSGKFNLDSYNEKISGVALLKNDEVKEPLDFHKHIKTFSLGIKPRMNAYLILCSKEFTPKFPNLFDDTKQLLIYIKYIPNIVFNPKDLQHLKNGSARY